MLQAEGKENDLILKRDGETFNIELLILSGMIVIYQYKVANRSWAKLFFLIKKNQMGVHAAYIIVPLWWWNRYHSTFYTSQRGKGN